MDGTIHPATAQQRFVRRVDNDIDSQGGDVGVNGSYHWMTPGDQ